MWLNYKLLVPLVKSNTSWFIDFTSALGFEDAEGALGQLLMIVSLIETMLVMYLSLHFFSRNKNRA
jgi:hypothetical protein